MYEPTSILLAKYYQAFNDRDMSTFAGLLDDEVVHDLNQGHREKGKPAFMQFMDRMNTSYHERISDLTIMTDETGTRAAVEYTVDGVYLAGEVGLPPATGQKYRLRGGPFSDPRWTGPAGYQLLQSAGMAGPGICKPDERG